MKRSSAYSSFRIIGVSIRARPRWRSLRFILTIGFVSCLRISNCANNSAMVHHIKHHGSAVPPFSSGGGGRVLDKACA